MSPQQLQLLENLIQPLSTKEVRELTDTIKDRVNDLPGLVEINSPGEDSELETRSAEKEADKIIDDIQGIGDLVENYQGERLEKAKDVFITFSLSEQDIDFPLKEWIESSFISLGDTVELYTQSSEQKLYSAIDTYIQEVIGLYAPDNTSIFGFSKQTVEPKDKQYHHEFFQFLNLILCTPEHINLSTEQALASYQNNYENKKWFRSLYQLTEGAPLKVKNNNCVDSIQNTKEKIFFNLSKLYSVAYHPHNFQYFVLAASYNNEAFLSLYEEKLQNKTFLTQLSTQLSDLAFNIEKKLNEDKVLGNNNFFKNNQDYFSQLYLFNIKYFFKTFSHNITFSFPTDNNYFETNTEIKNNQSENYINTFALKNMLTIDGQKFPLINQIITPFLNKILTYSPEHLAPKEDIKKFQIQHEKNQLSRYIEEPNDQGIENKKFKL